MPIITHELLENAINYSAYVAMVRELLVQNQTTGIHATDAYWINMTKRNWERMDFLVESLELEKSIVKKLTAYQTPITWLAITEAWCVDSPESLCIVHKMAMLNPNIHLKIILRDSPPGIIDNFLTNESKSIPKIICLDTESLAILGTWGPRPAELQAKLMIKVKMLDNISKHSEEKSADCKKFMDDILSYYAEYSNYEIQREIINSLLF